MQTVYCQRGMSMWQVMFIMVLIGFTATAAVKMLPAYSDNRVAAQALVTVQEAFAGADIQQITDNQIRGKLAANFQVNMVSPEIEQAVQITREGEHVYLSIDYEVRQKLIGNVDVVMVFENEVELGL